MHAGVVCEGSGGFLLAHRSKMCQVFQLEQDLSVPRSAPLQHPSVTIRDRKRTKRHQMATRFVRHIRKLLLWCFLRVWPIWLWVPVQTKFCEACGFVGHFCTHISLFAFLHHFFASHQIWNAVHERVAITRRKVPQSDSFHQVTLCATASKKLPRMHTSDQLCDVQKSGRQVSNL